MGKQAQRNTVGVGVRGMQIKTDVGIKSGFIHRNLNGIHYSTFRDLFYTDTCTFTQRSWHKDFITVMFIIANDCT